MKSFFPPTFFRRAPRESLKVGFIGLGFISDIHLATLTGHPQVEVVALADISRRRLVTKAKQYGISRGYRDYRKILADPEITVVDILLPHYLHAGIVIESLEAGKTVICEKPLALTVREIDEIKGVVGQTKKQAYVKHYFRSARLHRKAQELLIQGTIGRPYLLQGLYTGNSLSDFNDLTNWKGDLIKAGGGVIMDNGLHLLDWWQSLFGKPRWVFARNAKVTTRLKNKGEDLGVVTLGYPKGVTANLICTGNDTSRGFSWEKHFWGTQGSLHLVSQDKDRMRLTLERDGEILWREEEQNWWDSANKEALKTIIGQIVARQKPRVDLREIHDLLATIESIYVSARQGKVRVLD